MQIFSKLTIRQWAGLCLVLALGTVGLMGLPVGAQEEPQTPADNAAQAEKPEAKPAETPAQLKETAPETKKLFEDARKKLLNRTYRANIVQKLQFPERTLEAKGQITRGPKHRVRLEFEIHSGGTVGKLLQVSNGDKLWTERRVNGDPPRLTVQDIKEILNKAGAAEENLVAAEMGLGGVTALLASMERTINFGKPQTVEVDGEKLRRVDGVWNEKFLSRMKANPQLAKGLSQYIPDGARVYFDADDFPRRIQYLKEHEDDEVLVPIVTMDFLDVEWLTDADVKPSFFEYEPPERVYPEDVTKTYVDQLNKRAAQPAPVPQP